MCYQTLGTTTTAHVSYATGECMVCGQVVYDGTATCSEECTDELWGTSYPVDIDNNEEITL